MFWREPATWLVDGSLLDVSSHDRGGVRWSEGMGGQGGREREREQALWCLFL